MPIFVIANPKGGVGKSTFSTNLAGYFASQGHQVMLGDADIQQSSRAWLKLRPANLRTISSWDIKEGRIANPPKGTTHIVLDTPAGLSGTKLDNILKLADKIIVPLQPSMFDILATEDFIRKLSEHSQANSASFSVGIVGIVGMRVNARTRAADQLAQYMSGLNLPVLGYLRDTQNYIQLAAHGATLWDVAPSKVEKDIEQWQDIMRWINKK